MSIVGIGIGSIYEEFWRAEGLGQLGLLLVFNKANKIQRISKEHRVYNCKCSSVGLVWLINTFNLHIVNYSMSMLYTHKVQ